MARGATVNVDDLSPERQAEIAEQARRHEEESAEWNSFFEAIDERIVSPKMTAIANELAETGRWMSAEPKSETRLSGTGVKSAGQFKGVIDGRERPVDFSVELFPSNNGRFIAYLDVNGSSVREVYQADDFSSEQAESDERLENWLESQIDRHVRGKAFA